MYRSSLVAFVLLAACTDDSSPGEDLYSGTASKALGDPDNQAACATCHSSDGTTAGFSGATFKDIAYRSHYKGGEAPDLLAASNACIGGWMGGTPLTAGDARWKDLEGFLKSISSTTVTTPNGLAPEVLADVAAYEAAYAGGNASAGAAKFMATCARCHDHALQVGLKAAPAKATLKTLAIGRIAQQVRTSGPPPSGTADTMDSTPGPMPFFEPDDLSIADLKDIIAHIRM